MSFLQLVSPEENPANFNVQFAEVIKINKNSKIALINLTGQSTFSINIIEVMKEFPYGMNTNFKIGDGNNSILLNVNIFATDFDAYDKTNITINNLLDVLADKINDVMLDYCAIGDPTDKAKRIAKYRIKFEIGLLEYGDIGVFLNGMIKDTHILDNYNYFVPDWDATNSNNMDFTDKEAPKSDGSTSSASPAYCCIDYENGVGVNGNYMSFLVNTDTDNFSVALSIKGHDLTKEYFEIDDTDEEEIYAPVVLRFIKKATPDDFATLQVIQHDPTTPYTATPNPEDNLVIFNDEVISETTQIEIWINNNATILIRYTTSGILSQDILIDGIDEDYSFSSVDLASSSIVPVLYTITPNIQPIFNFRYTNSYNVKQETDEQFYFRWNDLEEDKLFMPIYWAPNDFHNFLGFYKDSIANFNPRDNGSFNISSDRQIASNINGVDKLNIHITNLPIRSYKNKQNEKFNGFTTTLIRDVQYDGIGNINYDPPHIIYADLHNLNENINNLNIQIRDAYDNKITNKLVGSTILTLHLIN